MRCTRKGSRPLLSAFVIRQFIEQEGIVVGAVAGTDAPFGMKAFASRHRQAVLLPTVVIVVYQLKIIFQRYRRLCMLRDQFRAGLPAPLVETRYNSVAHCEANSRAASVNQWPTRSKSCFKITSRSALRQIYLHV